MSNIDAHAAMQRHIGNLSRQVGHDVGNRYSYIISQDDLTNAYLQMRNDLGYPLMVDSKYRRAIVYNKQGIEKQIQKLVSDCMDAASKELASVVATDLANEVAAALNGLQQAANGTIVVGGGGGFKNSSNAAANRFAAALGKGLAKGLVKIVEEITNPKDNKRKR